VHSQRYKQFWNFWCYVAIQIAYHCTRSRLCSVLIFNLAPLEKELNFHLFHILGQCLIHVFSLYMFLWQYYSSGNRKTDVLWFEFSQINRCKLFAAVILTLILCRAYHVGGNGSKLLPLGPGGEFSLQWGELLVTCKANVPTPNYQK